MGSTPVVPPPLGPHDRATGPQVPLPRARDVLAAVVQRDSDRRPPAPARAPMAMSKAHGRPPHRLALAGHAEAEPAAPADANAPRAHSQPQARPARSAHTALRPARRDVVAVPPAAATAAPAVRGAGS